MAGMLRALLGPWAIGGDWNCTPEELAATGWLQLVNAKLFAPAAHPCNGKVYDFFVVADRLHHAVFAVHTLGATHPTPHLRVPLLLTARPTSRQRRHP